MLDVLVFFLCGSASAWGFARQSAVVPSGINRISRSAHRGIANDRGDSVRVDNARKMPTSPPPPLLSVDADNNATTSPAVLLEAEEQFAEDFVSDEAAVVHFADETAFKTTSVANDSGGSASVPAVPADPSPSDPLSLWKMRLITREDPYSIHKISSAVYTLSGFCILARGSLRYMSGTFETVPDSLEAATHAFFLSNAVMCLGSVRMAFVHRRFDLTARNGFLGTASVSLFTGFYMEWTSPFAAADVFNDVWVNRACFAAFVLLNTYFVMDTVSKIPEVVEGRRDKKAADFQGRAVADIFLYILPVAAALPAVIFTAFVESVMHDRLWYLSQCELIWDTTGVPFSAHAYYLQVLASMAASYGALAVTLRDKKLISKTAEWSLISVFSIPALIWTVYVAAVFVQSMM